VHYDKTGRSKGTAHVVFERPQDALAAYQKYNSVALDGKKLQLELVETEIPPGTFAQLKSGIKCVRWGGWGCLRAGAGGAGRAGWGRFD